MCLTGITEQAHPVMAAGRNIWGVCDNIQIDQSVLPKVFHLLNSLN